jgi:hypothetical protein
LTHLRGHGRGRTSTRKDQRGLDIDQESGTRVQTWLPIPLVEQLKAQADLERRSVSAVIRLAVEDQLRKDGRRP